MTSSFGSQVIFRPVRMAMSQRWLIMSERTASSMGLIAGLRDLTASMKFWPCRWLASAWESPGRFLVFSSDLGSASMPRRRI